MKFYCKAACQDSGFPLRAGEAKPNIRGYRQGLNYDLGEHEVERLITIGLFPECFEAELLRESVKTGREYSPEGVDYWNAHIEEWERRASQRFLPYRPYTEEEEKLFAALTAERKRGGQGWPPHKAAIELQRREREERKGERGSSAQSEADTLREENERLREENASLKRPAPTQTPKRAAKRPHAVA